MKLINLDPRMNPAQVPCMNYAQQRANREGRPMAVCVGPPGTSSAQHPANYRRAVAAHLFNDWFVRPYGDGLPVGAELYAAVFPERPGVLPIVQRFFSDRFVVAPVSVAERVFANAA